MVEHNGEAAIYIEDPDSVVRVSEILFQRDGPIECRFTLHIKLGDAAEITIPGMLLTLTSGREGFDVLAPTDDICLSKELAYTIKQRLEATFFLQQFSASPDISGVRLRRESPTKIM